MDPNDGKKNSKEEVAQHSRHEQGSKMEGG